VGYVQAIAKAQLANRGKLEWLQAPRWRLARWAVVLLMAVNLLGLNALAWLISTSWQPRKSHANRADGQLSKRQNGHRRTRANGVRSALARTDQYRSVCRRVRPCKALITPMASCA
jgi:hypothetical protein